MGFSIRELIGLTAYAGLLLAKVHWLSVILMLGSSAAWLFIVVIFGFYSLQLLVDVESRGRCLSWLLPLVLIATGGYSLILFEAMCFDRLPYVGLYFAPTVEFALLLGLASASLPVLFCLDSKRLSLTEHTLRTGYWALFLGMMSAGTTFLIQAHGFGSTAEFPDVYRIPAAISVTVAVLAALLMTPKQEHKKEEEDALESSPFD